MNDPGAIILAVVWAVVACAFGWGWLHGGNGRWRWQQRWHDRTVNSSIYGLIALAALFGVAWYVYVTVLGNTPTRSVWSYRLIREVPLLGVFAAVAAILKPWKAGP